MADRNKDAFRILRIKKGDDLKTIYAKARKAFTAADLQRYAVIEKGVRGEQLQAELDAIHREEMRKRRNQNQQKLYR